LYIAYYYICISFLFLKINIIYYIKIAFVYNIAKMLIRNIILINKVKKNKRINKKK